MSYFNNMSYYEKLNATLFQFCCLPHRDTEILNDVFIMKKKIWSKSMSLIQCFIIHCVQMSNLTAVARVHHTEFHNTQKSLWFNLCLMVTKHRESVIRHRLRHKAIMTTRSAPNPAYHTLNMPAREINNLYPACTVKHWRHRAQRWGNSTWKHT